MSAVQTPQQAAEVQRALDAALYEPIPQPDALESNSDEAWRQWDMVVAQSDEQWQGEVTWA